MCYTIDACCLFILNVAVCTWPSVQFSSVAQSCLTLCDPMDGSTPGLPVHHQLPEFTQTLCPLSRWCHPTISSSVAPFFSCLPSFPVSGSFQMSQFFSSGGQSTGVSASASVLPVNIQNRSHALNWNKHDEYLSPLSSIQTITGNYAKN